MSRRIGLVVAVVALSVASTTSLSAQTIIVKAARLIDGRGGAPLEPAMVRIVGEHVEQVAATLPVPAGARLIDLGSATLLPGLIDLHTHLTDRDDVHWETALTTTTPPEAALWGARNARVTLMAGVTTCRDMGPTWPYVDVELRKAIEAGAVPGPRMLVAGNYVSSTGGAGDARQFSIYLDVPLVRTLADGADEIVKAVRTNFKYGADFIKILVTGAVLSKGITPGAQQYSDAEIQAAVTEATRWGRPVAAHAHGADGIKAAIRAGVRTVDHGILSGRRGGRDAEAEPTHVLRADAGARRVHGGVHARSGVGEGAWPHRQRDRRPRLQARARGQPADRSCHRRARDAARAQRPRDRIPRIARRVCDARHRRGDVGQRGDY